MLCQKCGKNQANVLYKQMINGEYKEISLCSECAKDLEMPFNLFKKPTHMNELNTSKVCNLCGSTIRDIMQNGKAGCPKCYDIFRNELSNTIAHIHGMTAHTGRAPHQHKMKNMKRIKINNLKSQLKEAIAKQEFESAAKLRDEINLMEQGDN